VSLTPKQKIDSVERQINECMRGDSKEIVCPYCKSSNVPENKALCCADMGLTVLAILRKDAQQECLRQAAVVFEAVDRMN
jgi:predicted nucleic acid-binding protein